MKDDEAVFASRTTPSNRQPGDVFVWDPRATQLFTPQDAQNSGELTGASSSFDKYEGNGVIAMGALHIATDDGGTTTWGRLDSTPAGESTIIEIASPEGELHFASSGKLVVGDSDRWAELRVYNANGDAGNSGPNDERIGMELAAKEVEFSYAIIDIKNKSGLQVAGSESGGLSSLTVGRSIISVHDGSVCRIMPNVGERRIAVKASLEVIISDTSFVEMGASVWDFSQGSEAQFSLEGVRQAGLTTKNYCYLSGFDFRGTTYYPPGMFNFITEDEYGPLLTNNGEFVFAGIGDAFQVAAMMDKQLIAIDNVAVSSFSLIADDFKDGNLHLRLK